MGPAGTDCLPHSTTTMTSGGCLNAMENHNGDIVGNLNQCTGKPPRDVSAMRHCSSSTWLAESVSIIMSYVVFRLIKYMN